MKDIDSLEAITSLLFIDGDNELERIYQGLLNLKIGDSFVLTGTNLPIKQGKYLVTKDNQHQITVSIDNSDHDKIVRDYELVRQD